MREHLDQSKTVPALFRTVARLQRERGYNEAADSAERAAQESERRQAEALTHCEGCDTPQPDVRRVRWSHHDERGEALWCKDCRSAATAVTFGAFAGGERTIISTRRA